MKSRNQALEGKGIHSTPPVKPSALGDLHRKVPVGISMGDVLSNLGELFQWESQKPVRRSGWERNDLSGAYRLRFQ